MNEASSKALYELKNLAHAEFDVFWISKYESRRESYKWMQESMGKGHISELNAKQCVRFIELCKNRKAALGIPLTIGTQSQNWMQKRAERRRKEAIHQADEFCEIEEAYLQAL